jgi:O-acetyl-ADP-ribose deacetylase (regulator of RNase III)
MPDDTDMTNQCFWISIVDWLNATKWLDSKDYTVLQLRTDANKFAVINGTTINGKHQMLDFSSGETDGSGANLFFSIDALACSLGIYIRIFYYDIQNNNIIVPHDCINGWTRDGCITSGVTFGVSNSDNKNHILILKIGNHYELIERCRKGLFDYNITTQTNQLITFSTDNSLQYYKIDDSSKPQKGTMVSLTIGSIGNDEKRHIEKATEESLKDDKEFEKGIKQSLESLKLNEKLEELNEKLEELENEQFENAIRESIREALKRRNTKCELKTIHKTDGIKLLGFIYTGHNVKFIYREDGNPSNENPSIKFEDYGKITIKLLDNSTKTHHKPNMSPKEIQDIFSVVYSYLCKTTPNLSDDIIFSLSGDKCININIFEGVGADDLLTNIQGKGENGENGKYLTVAKVKEKLNNTDTIDYDMLIVGDITTGHDIHANIYEITKDVVTIPYKKPDPAPAPAPAPAHAPEDGPVNTDISGIISKIRMEHNDNYTRALGEITNCKKAEHWVWYIFPEPPSPYHSTDEAKDNELGYDMVEEYLLSDTECADKQTLLKHYANILTALWRCLWKKKKNINEILPNSEDKPKVKASVIMFTNAAENLLKRPKIVGPSKHGDLTIIKETGILILRSFINIDEPLYYRIYIGKKNQIRLHIQTGNLLDLNLNYIVNAANRSGIANGNTKGIDGEFYKRGGDELIQARKNKMSGNVTLPGGIMLPGSTMFTPRKYGSIKAIDGIIHAVGPESTKRFIKKHTDALNNAYMGSFSHCKDDIKNTKKKNVSIGFPVLLGGEFAHIDDNIQIAVTTGLNSIVKYFDSTEDDGISDVYFVISDPGKNKDRAEYILQRHECTTWFKKCTDDTKWFGPKQK